MSIATQKYSRKPFDVDAVQITAENLDAIADWTLGTIIEEPGNDDKPGTRYIKIKIERTMNERQTRGYVGDWVLWNERGGFKIYTTQAFKTTFDAVKDSEPKSQLTTTEKLLRVSSVPGQV